MTAPCRDCGVRGPCLPDCACAKCTDPEGYEDWRNNNPREYGDWLRRNGFDTSCERCGGDRYPVECPHGSYERIMWIKHGYAGGPCCELVECNCDV